MLIECLIPRDGVTQVQLEGGYVYNFVPDQHGRAVCLVNNDAHVIHFKRLPFYCEHDPRKTVEELREQEGFTMPTPGQMLTPENEIPDYEPRVPWIEKVGTYPSEEGKGMPRELKREGGKKAK